MVTWRQVGRIPEDESIGQSAFDLFGHLFRRPFGAAEPLCREYMAAILTLVWVADSTGNPFQKSEKRISGTVLPLGRRGSVKAKITTAAKVYLFQGVGCTIVMAIVVGNVVR